MRKSDTSSDQSSTASTRPPHTLFGSGQTNPNRSGRGKKQQQPSMTSIVHEQIELPTPDGEKVKTTCAELADEMLIADALKGDPRSIREVYRRLDLEQNEQAERTRQRLSKISPKIRRQAWELVVRLFANRIEPLQQTVARLEAEGLLTRVNGQLLVPEWLRTTGRMVARNGLRHEGACS